MNTLVFQGNNSTIILKQEGTRRKAIILDDGKEPYSRYLSKGTKGVANLFKVREVHVIIE